MSLYRLRSSAFGRPEESNKAKPKSIVFLSVEGDATEKDYFTRLNEHIDNAVIHVEILRHRRGEGYNDPENVIGLLREYFAIRNENILPSEVKEALKNDKTDLEIYLADPCKLSRKRRNEVKAGLLRLGIDIEYRKYLRQLGTDRDIFGVLIDRDCGCHSREVMEECIKECINLDVGCYISNPCFEFWLLLHLCDVRSEYTDEQLEELCANRKVSNCHTVISREISERAGHEKSISSGKFSKVYWPNLNLAVKRSKLFACDSNGLLDNLGSNVSLLIEAMGIVREEDKL